MTRRDLVIDSCYVIVFGAYIYVTLNHMSDGRLGAEIEMRARHSVDWMLHRKRLDDQVKEGAPQVMWEALQAIDKGEPNG